MEAAHHDRTFPAHQTPPDLAMWHCQSCGISAQNLLVLPSCGHMFCSPCVDQWLWSYISEQGGQGRRYPCQACHTTYQIPPDGLDAFMQNVNVLRLELELQKLTMATNGNNNSVVMVESMPSTTDESSSMDSNDSSIMDQEQKDNIMQNLNAARSGDYSSENNLRYGFLPFTSYCRLPHHLY